MSFFYFLSPLQNNISIKNNKNKKRYGACNSNLKNVFISAVGTKEIINKIMKK